MAGTKYTFEVAGIYNGLFVMKDRQNGSVWSHYEGKVLFGDSLGLQMDMVPLAQTTWAEWLAQHPDTLVLDERTGFEQRYRENVRIGREGLSPTFRRTLLNWDERLPESEMILGVEVNGEYRAYLLAEMPAGTGAINDSLGGEPVVILSGQNGSFARAFLATVAGEVLTFLSDGETVTDNLGNTWSLDGKCLSGSLQDRELQPVSAFVSEWYGWAAYHPQTSIYGRAE